MMSATLPRLRETPQGVTVKRQSEVPAEAQDSSLSASPLLGETGEQIGRQFPGQMMLFKLQ
jgi:hypothetical protein